jgi:Ser/Thr protein kinase RdoA (MazF antagonist)
MPDRAKMSEAIATVAASRMEGLPAVLSCERMSSGFSNANYRLETSTGKFLLRECTGRDRAGVEYELDVLDWLRSHQFPSAASIRFDGGDRWISGPGDSMVVVLSLGEPLPGGLIHGDVFTDNTLFRDGQLVAILDFEDACEDAFLFDVAMTIHGFCFPAEQWRPDLAEAFLDAYIERRALTDPERELLPTYLRWCPLAIMGWHLRQLRRRPDKENERRAAELTRRIETMRGSNWPPSEI